MARPDCAGQFLRAVGDPLGGQQPRRRVGQIPGQCRGAGIGRPAVSAALRVGHQFGRGEHRQAGHRDPRGHRPDGGVAVAGQQHALDHGLRRRLGSQPVAGRQDDRQPGVPGRARGRSRPPRCGPRPRPVAPDHPGRRAPRSDRWPPGRRASGRRCRRNRPPGPGRPGRRPSRAGHRRCPLRRRSRRRPAPAARSPQWRSPTRRPGRARTVSRRIAAPTWSCRRPANPVIHLVPP